jgi:hypothetical protein
MSVPLKKVQNASRREDRRRFQRVNVNLLGRYMLPDRREFPCQVQNMSLGGMYVVAPVAGRLQERVVAYVDHVGRVEGVITRLFDNGFAMTIAASARKRDKLAAQLTWLANRHILNLPEDRRHDRVVPKNNSSGRVVLPNGRDVAVQIIDMSASGVGVKSELRPEIGTSVAIGKTSGRVVRHLDNGFAIEFARMLPLDFIEEIITGQ